MTPGNPPHPLSNPQHSRHRKSIRRACGFYLHLFVPRLPRGLVSRPRVRTVQQRLQSDVRTEERFEMNTQLNGAGNRTNHTSERV
jgi:hypothetical protein